MSVGDCLSSGSLSVSFMFPSRSALVDGVALNVILCQLFIIKIFLRVESLQTFENLKTSN